MLNNMYRAGVGISIALIAACSYPPAPTVEPPRITTEHISPEKSLDQKIIKAERHIESNLYVAQLTSQGFEKLVNYHIGWPQGHTPEEVEEIRGRIGRNIGISRRVGLKNDYIIIPDGITPLLNAAQDDIYNFIQYERRFIDYLIIEANGELLETRMILELFRNFAKENPPKGVENLERLTDRIMQSVSANIAETHPLER